MRAHRLIKVLLPLLFFFLKISISMGQRALPCGDYKINTEEMQKILNYEKTHPSPPLASYAIRVFFHICVCDDGSIPAATVAQMDTEFNTLVASYSADNICFVNMGVNYVYNTKLDTNFNANTDNSNLFDPYRISNCINIFYMTKIKGNNNACSSNCGIGGTSITIPSTICLISKNNVNAGQTVSHEVGHCMGLYHTFENNNGAKYEDIDGSNSTTNGDLITDTPADPFAYNNKSCFTTSLDGCTYTGTCTDPKGASNFSTPYTNLMSYWWNGNAVTCYTGLAITSGQYTRVNSTLSSNSSLQGCEGSTEVTVGPNINKTSGYTMSSAVDVLTTTGSVVYSGSSITTFGGGTVLMEPGFRSSPSTNALFLARASTCSASFRLTDENVDAFNEALKSGLSSYPNPASSEVNIVISLNEDLADAVLDIFDTNLKLVGEQHIGALHSGVQTEQVGLENLPSGIYYLRLKSSASQLTTKIVVIK